MAVHPHLSRHTFSSAVFCNFACRRQSHACASPAEPRYCRPHNIPLSSPWPLTNSLWTQSAATASALHVLISQFFELTTLCLYINKTFDFFSPTHQLLGGVSSYVCLKVFTSAPPPHHKHLLPIITFMVLMDQCQSQASSAPTFSHRVQHCKDLRSRLPGDICSTTQERCVRSLDAYPSYPEYLPIIIEDEHPSRAGKRQTSEGRACFRCIHNMEVINFRC